jgi:multidrug efflux pump subunit AcrA (membrane-fusion protein)
MDTSSSANALSALNNFKRTSSQDLITSANAKYGVDELSTRVKNLNTVTGNLTNAIKAVDPSVTARTAGTLTTEGQRSALVAREQAPLTGQLAENERAVGLAQGDLSTATTKASDEARGRATDEENQYQTLLTTYNIANAQETARREAEERAAAAARDQANKDREYAESKRQFDAQLSASKAKSGSTKTPSAAETKAAVTQHVAQGLAGSTGKDGKVSNETWAAALADAVAVGYTPRTFWQQFGQYVNPKYKSSYAGYNQR